MELTLIRLSLRAVVAALVAGAVLVTLAFTVSHEASAQVSAGDAHSARTLSGIETAKIPVARPVFPDSKMIAQSLYLPTGLLGPLPGYDLMLFLEQNLYLPAATDVTFPSSDDVPQTVDFVLNY